MAIALAANIGGQSSPISSPQNIIALQEMDPSLDWAKWFAVALPVSAVSIILIWWLLLWSYQPARSPDGEGDIEIKAIRPTKEAFTIKQYWVTFVCLLTISLWCVEHQIEAFVGDMGVIALIPIIAFFSTGVLKKVPFRFPVPRSDSNLRYRMTLIHSCGRLYSSLWVVSPWVRESCPVACYKLWTRSSGIWCMATRYIMSS